MSGPQPEMDMVRLEGGPMAGWIVKPDAPSLRPDWCTTWPRSISRHTQPGHYGEPALDDMDVWVARWEEHG